MACADDDSFRLGARPVTRVEIVGDVVWLQRRPQFLKLLVDDGTALAPVVWWARNDDGSPKIAAPVALGDLVRVRGKLRRSAERFAHPDMPVEVIATAVRRLDDPDAQAVAWLDRVRLRRDAYRDGNLPQAAAARRRRAAPGPAAAAAAPAPAAAAAAAPAPDDDNPPAKRARADAAFERVADAVMDRFRAAPGGRLTYRTLADPADAAMRALADELAPVAPQGISAAGRLHHLLRNAVARLAAPGRALIALTDEDRDEYTFVPANTVRDHVRAALAARGGSARVAAVAGDVHAAPPARVRAVVQGMIEDSELWESGDGEIALLRV